MLYGEIEGRPMKNLRKPLKRVLRHEKKRKTKKGFHFILTVSNGVFRSQNPSSRQISAYAIAIKQN